MFRELRLRKIRIKHQEKLNSRNLALYKVITNNIQNSDLRNIEREEILQDVLDMMLQVQIEDKPVEVIVGDDYRVFCESIINEYQASKPRIYKVLSFIQKYMILIMFVSFFTIIPAAKLSEGISGIRIAVSNFIYVNAIVLFIIPFIKKCNRKSLGNYEGSYLSNFFTGAVIDKEENGLSKILFLVSIGLVVINTLFSRVVGINLSTHYIYPFKYRAVIPGLLIATALIQIYKIVYDKK